MPDRGTSTLCVIPARGGSKGIARKNLQDLAGKPLIVHSIEAALAARTPLVTVVSTDDAEIAAVAEAAGCRVIRRPPPLAEDTSPIEPALLHALEMAAAGRTELTTSDFRHVLLLQPTSPFRSPADIDAALDLLVASAADSVVGLVDVGEMHPARMYRLDEGRMQALFPEPAGRRRQDLPPVYIRNGAIYACTVDLLRNRLTLLGEDCRGYVMPRERSINIDTPEDLEHARHLASRRRLDHAHPDN